jgi:hypothetical protein
MAPITISLLAFILPLVGVFLGSVMQRVLPEGHLSSDSKEVVKLSIGVVATLAALVLGLLVASAKSTYDARESEINQITAYVILLELACEIWAGGSIRTLYPPPINSTGRRSNLERRTNRTNRNFQGYTRGRGLLSASSGLTTHQ